MLKRWEKRYGTQWFLYEARRCDACRKTGCRGRIGLFELLTVTPHLRQMMLRRRIEKVLSGETDLHEVRAAAL